MQFRFHHAALAVHDIEAATTALLACGFQTTPEFPDTCDETLGVQLRFLRQPAGAPLLELVAGVGASSPVAELLAQRGPTLYHMCFEVEQFAAAVSELRKQGYRPVTQPLRAQAFQKRKIQFLHHPDAGLIELLEK